MLCRLLSLHRHAHTFILEFPGLSVCILNKLVGNDLIWKQNITLISDVATIVQPMNVAAIATIAVHIVGIAVQAVEIAMTVSASHFWPIYIYNIVEFEVSTCLSNLKFHTMMPVSLRTFSPETLNSKLINQIITKAICKFKKFIHLFLLPVSIPIHWCL